MSAHKFLGSHEKKIGLGGSFKRLKYYFWKIICGFKPRNRIRSFAFSQYLSHLKSSQTFALIESLGVWCQAGI